MTTTKTTYTIVSQTVDSESGIRTNRRYVVGTLRQLYSAYFGAEFTRTIKSPTIESLLVVLNDPARGVKTVYTLGK